MLEAMQKIFRIWMIVIFILALIAAFIVDIQSPFFGFVLLPLIIVTGAIIALGSVKK